MSATDRPILIATRGSPLALAQARQVLATCAAAWPDARFELRLIRTTGDKLQRASLATPAASLPKGLFTKELEVALLAGEADLAVHSLKDLPTELPAGLELAAVTERVDARDVLVCRGPTARIPPVPAARALAPRTPLADLRDGATVATSSTRRRDQLLATRPDLHIVEIRGNVGTRLQKVATQPEIDATVLAAAGLARLGFQIAAHGGLSGPEPGATPAGLLAVFLDTVTMIPCVGQAAIGLETRAGDARLAAVCARLNHAATRQCVTAERAFLRAMGGGCQSPVAAFAEIDGTGLRLRAVSFRDGPVRRGELAGPPTEAERIGAELAERLCSPPR
jgi:hydroxymethylbilane synthase